MDFVHLRNREHIVDDSDGGPSYDSECVDTGAAKYMLSYTWGQEVDVLVDTLIQYCNRVDLDLKSTSVWICFAW